MSGSFQSLIVKDHENIIALFASYRAVPRDNLQKCREIFQMFDRQLRSHIRVENEIFLPLFEDGSTQHLANSSRTLRQDHDRFLELLTRIQDRLSRGELEGPEENTLYHLFLSHTFEEHNKICPYIDGHLSLGERQMALRRMKAIERAARAAAPVSDALRNQPAHP